MSRPNVTIIILNWNGLRDTVDCLKSIRKIAYPNYDIVVVDNGSTDGSPEEIKKLYPDVKLLVSATNLGYAGGNNIGIDYAVKRKSDYILLLNNDTIVDSNILKSFVESAVAYPDCGIFSAKIYYYSEPTKIWFAGGVWDNKRFRIAHIGQNRSDDEKKYDTFKEIDYGCGCALFFRRTVAERVGFLEEKFFLIYEETDWCYRAKAAGFKVLYVPTARVWHKISISFGGASSPMQGYFTIRNQLLWASRNFGFMQRWAIYLNIIRRFFPSTFDTNEFPTIKRIYWDILSIARNKGSFLAKLIGFFDFVRGKFGQCPNIIVKLQTKKNK